MGINLASYYPGGVALKTSFYCYYCHGKMEEERKDKLVLNCKACNKQTKLDNPVIDDELLDYQKFPDKF
ncbi:hypothetical protein HYV81_04065 [Candidatus Woesearchaeota archaeon]|nr:hypothetical protein [Candidatus Woesearchaeota archaeon]